MLARLTLVALLVSSCASASAPKSDQPAQASKKKAKKPVSPDTFQSGYDDSNVMDITVDWKDADHGREPADEQK
jgi:hypothetical protein